MAKQALRHLQPSMPKNIPIDIETRYFGNDEAVATGIQVNIIYIIFIYAAVCKLMDRFLFITRLLSGDDSYHVYSF